MKPINFVTPHEEFCFNTAVYFTGIRGRTPKHRTREEFDSFQEAIDYATTFNDKRTMIYAVNAVGNNAHICNS